MRVRLSGYVAADEDVRILKHYGYPAFGPEDVRNAIDETPEGEDLVFEINSLGGSVWAGSEIYSVLMGAQKPTKAEIQSVAASAASYLCLACDSVWMSPVAQMMMHLPATRTEGDRNDHTDSIHFLDSVAEGILNAYEQKVKGKKTREELASMMQSTRWMPAQEALDAGLIDGILSRDAPENVLNAAEDILGMPDITRLRAQYREQQAGEPAPNPTNNEWQQSARQLLEIEKIRF